MTPSLVSDYALKRLEGCRMGSVHSTFATSFNIDMDGFLLHVGSDDAPLSCLGLSIATDEMERLRTSVELGDRAVLHDGVLRIYGRYGIGEIDICAAPIHACSVPAFASDEPVGIDIRKVVATGITPIINTGIAHKKAGIGQVGAGTVRAPLACFEQALEAYCAKLGIE